MLVSAFILLAIAVAIGLSLAVLHLRTDEGAMPPSWLAALHGLLAILGLCGLAAALRGPPRGLAQGMESFGLIAAVLLAVAALAGMGMLAARVFKKRISGTSIGIHATLAVGGFVILAAYIFAG